MAGIKSLAKDTAVYGLSSIVGRFLNWCLVPLYTSLFLPEEYGVVTFVYTVVALALIVLTYGMETGFFRFANHERWSDPMEVYSTALISLAATSLIFIVGGCCFAEPISGAMECEGHVSYVVIMAVCVAIDAFLALPYSYLRYRKRPIRFATIRLVNIALNIGLNLFFLLLCPVLMKHFPKAVGWFYNPDFGIGYIFLSNLIASAVNFVMMIPELRGFAWRFNRQLWGEMLRYSAPLLVLGVAGIMNQTVDKLLYPTLAPDKAEAMTGLGIYGANYKIAIVMVMFIQAFRFAYEPFIFSQAREKGENKNQAYADAMKYFVVFGLLIFMGVMFYLDILKYFIAADYFSGLKVVPIIMLAELFFGIFFNLSLWYKLSDQTVWGMWFSLFGLAITVVLNVVLVPRYGYIGCAVAAFCSYGAMMLVSYFIGQKKYPIKYQVGRIALYCLLAAVLYAAGMYALPDIEWLRYLVRAVLIIVFVAVVAKCEHLPLKSTVNKLLHRR